MITASKNRLKQIIKDRVLRGPALKLEQAGVHLESLVECMRRTELFCYAEDSLLLALLNQMDVRRVKEGVTILREGFRGDSLVILASGKARVTKVRDGDRQARELAVLTRPSVIGGEALLGVQMRLVTVSLLEESTILSLKRADFARIVAAESVHWVQMESVGDLPGQSGWLWIGEPGSRPRGLNGVACLTMDRLRDLFTETHPAQHYYCCSRDEMNSAMAAFFLSQRGLSAAAVHDGKRLASFLPGRGEQA